MKNEKKDLNTETGNIAGMPGGQPASGLEWLGEPEISAGAGGGDQPQHENRPADLAHPQAAPGAYGGNFGNGTQASHHDQPRRDNEDSDANRGEFGVQSPADEYAEYSFEHGTAPAPEAGWLNEPAGAHANDNGALKGPESGYAADYGHTSFLAPQVCHHSLGQPAEPHQSSRRGRDEGRRGAAIATSPADDRSGYVQAPDGNANEGLGSRGGSYNDTYDDSRPGSTAGLPAPGDQRREDLADNYGAEAREENRATDEENRVDHGVPQRNAGRD